MEKMELPSGWSTTLLGKYIYVQNGYAFKSNEYCESILNQTVPVIRISDLDGQHVNLTSAVHVKKISVAELEQFKLENEDLLIAMSGATTGKLGVYKSDDDSYQNQRVGNLKLLSCKHGIKAFRNRLIQLFQNKILEMAYGGAQPNISAKAIESISINLPPLAEQKEIVRIIESHLKLVDQIKSRLDALPKLLEQFRQSVLASAVSGKLVEKKTNWISVTINDIADVFTGKTPSRKEGKYWINGDIPWLTSSETGLNVVDIAQQFVTKIAVDECNLKIFPKNTLLLAMYGEGKTRGQVTELNITATCNQACAAIIVDQDKVKYEYLKTYLKHNYEETRKAASGGNQPNLNLSKVREIALELPPLKEQAEIVKRVESLFAFADQIESKIKNAQERVNLLTQSILAKAFRGEFTVKWREDNPDLISRENSAEALLKQIEEAKKV